MPLHDVSDSLTSQVLAGFQLSDILGKGLRTENL